MVKQSGRRRANKGIVLAPPQSCFGSGDGDSIWFSSPPQAPFFAALSAAAVCPNGSPRYAGLFELR